MSAWFGQPDDVAQHVTQLVAAGCLVQQEGADTDEAVEQVVFSEGGRSAMPDAFRCGGQAFADESPDVPVEGLPRGRVPLAAVTRGGVEQEGQGGRAVVQPGMGAGID